MICAAIWVLTWSAQAAPASAPKTAIFDRGAVASSCPIASQVGADILRRGGNAVDAAVAVAFALAVTYPTAGNLGGGGFMMVRMADGRSEAVDYRERAPAAADRDLYLRADARGIERASLAGALACGVPGTVAGMWKARERYGSGRLSWRQLLSPARRLAADGFIVSADLAADLRSGEATLSRHSESRRIFLNAGAFHAAGTRFTQPELAATLRRIAAGGVAGFYEGETARLLVAEVVRGGGIVTREDLSRYRTVPRKPLRAVYDGNELLLMPPPSSGGVAIVQCLNMIRGRMPGVANARESTAWHHLLVEAMRRAYSDRSEFLGDSDHVEVPVRALLEPAYSATRMASFDPARATSPSAVVPGEPQVPGGGHTTHFSVVDVRGNAVSNTYTLNDSYGSGVTVTGAGFLLNNEMDDFTTRPGRPNAYGLVQGSRNEVGPGRRPLSSMSPTIVVREGKVVLVLGSPGGPRIISTVLQVMLGVLAFGHTLPDAAAAPRIHHQWRPDTVQVEPSFPQSARAALVELGHTLAERPPMGDVQAIHVATAPRRLVAVSDPRGPGAPAGH